MAVYTYDPKQNFVSLGGVTLTGFAEDTFIEIERSEDTFTDKVGASGEVARIKNNNRTGNIKFTTMASSATNDFLSAVANADEISNNGILAFFMQEFNGTTVCKSSEVWVKKMPATARGKELGQVQWELRAADLNQFHGGLVR